MNSAAPREFMFFLLRDKLSEFSDDSYIEKNSYPFLVSLNSKYYSIFVNETHDSGKGRTNKDECRIQINREQWDTAQSNKSVFLGYHSATNIFSIWEPDLINKRKNPSTFSIYSRFSKLEEAKKEGCSAYGFPSQVLKRETFCLSFRTDMIGLVLEESGMIWDTGAEKVGQVFDNTKQKISATTKKYKRSSKFKTDVLLAYNNSCAFCSLQMGIIEAAHIIPHSHEQGTDLVQNGIALCPNHHRMFDSGLIGLTEDLRVTVNRHRVCYLKKLNISTGADDLARIDKSETKLPSISDWRPSLENIRKANKIRGIDWD